MNIKINQIKVLDFKPKELTAEFEILFSTEGKLNTIFRKYLLKQPRNLLDDIIYSIKSKDKIIIDDPTLNPVERLQFYSPILIENQDQTEEKILNFLTELCKKAYKLKNAKEAKEHLKLLDEFKTANLVL